MLSIVTVAKGRKDITQRSFESIWTNCHDKDNIEHLIATDHDDGELNSFIKEYMEAHPECRISHNTVQIEPYSQRNIHKDYWNPLVREAKGEIIFGLTNDAIITTKHFDKILFEALDDHKIKHRHSYFQILIDDDYDSLVEGCQHDSVFCSWIILTRPAAKIFDGIAPSEIVFSSADQYVARVFGNSLIPSLIDLREEIKSENISHYTGKQEVADDVTLSKPMTATSWKAVAERKYDLALDYAIMKQVKWVTKRLKDNPNFSRDIFNSPLTKKLPWVVAAAAKFPLVIKCSACNKLTDTTMEWLDRIEQGLLRCPCGAKLGVSNPALEGEEEVLDLVNISSDGRGLFDYATTELPIPR